MQEYTELPNINLSKLFKNTKEGIWYWNTETDETLSSNILLRELNFIDSNKVSLQDLKKLILTKELSKFEDKLDLVRYGNVESLSPFKVSMTVNSRLTSFLCTIYKNSPISLIILFCNLTKIDKLQDRLSLSDKLASEAIRFKGEFITSINHIMRTPLNGINGFAELLQSENGNLNEFQIDCLNNIILSSKSLLYLADKIGEYSSLDSRVTVSLNYSPTILKDLVTQLVNLFGNSHNIVININLKEDIPEIVYIDSIYLTKILYYLLENAIQHSKGTEINIDMKLESFHESNLFISINILDNGIGIKETLIPTLFKPFNKESHSGEYLTPGLGLPLSKRMSRLIYGDLLLENIEHGGLSARLTFKALRDITTKTHIVNYDSHPLDIWLLDDNSVSLKILEFLFKSLKYNPKVYKDGWNMLKDFSTTDIKPNLIITDLHMPDLNGLTLGSRIRLEEKAYYAPTYLVLLSAEENPNLNFESQEAGFDDYFLKPITKEDVIIMIQQAHHRLLLNS